MNTGSLRDIDIVVLAGGLGTRLSPVLGKTPKLLAPVNGLPYLSFLLGWLKNFKARRIIFSLGHLADPISEFLHDNPQDGVEFVTVCENVPLGTAGAISNIRSKIHSDPVLIMNGDSFVDADLCQFVELHRDANAEASIICVNVADSSRYGTVSIDANNRISNFQEKTGTQKAGIINAGIYLFNLDVLGEVAIAGPSLERDFFQKQSAGRFAAMSGDFKFLDIGTPEDLNKAQGVLGRYCN
jgi:mannose-1-phosphate guanylyltransferase